MSIISNNKTKGEKDTSRLNEKEMELVKAICNECRTPADVTNMLKNLFAGTLEQMLEAEMEEHRGYEKNSVLGNNSGNSRNGFNRKTIKSEWGESEISVPRDRSGSFEPKAIEKRQTRTDDIEGLELSISVDQNKHKEIIPTKLQIIKMQYKKWQRRGATTTLTAALSGWMSGINVPLALINR